MEETTTGAVEDQGAVIAQPEVTETSAEAVTTTTEETTVSQETSEPSVDDNSEWLKAKGIDPSDPEAINKLAKSAREAERAMHQKAQKASELEKSMSEMSDESAEQAAIQTGQDPELLKRVQRFEVKSSIRDFFDANPEAKKYETQMIEEMSTSGLFGTPEAMLRAAYAISVSKDTDSVKSQAKRETLEKLAQKQQASVPTGNATNAGIESNTITPQNVDKLVAQNDVTWFKKNYEAINQAMSA